MEDPVFYPGLYSASGYDLIAILVGKPFATLLSSDVLTDRRISFVSWLDLIHNYSLAPSIARWPCCCVISRSPMNRLSTQPTPFAT